MSPRLWTLVCSPRAWIDLTAQAYFCRIARTILPVQLSTELCGLALASGPLLKGDIPMEVTSRVRTHHAGVDVPIRLYTVRCRRPKKGAAAFGAREERFFKVFPPPRPWC